MQKISGLDRETCIKIQNPVMDVFMMNELMEIGDTIAQQHLDIVTNNIRQHLLGTQSRLQNEQPKDSSDTSINYSEKPQVNKEMLAAVRKIDREGTSKSVNFMLFHKHHLNDDDMYWLSSIFNTHTHKGLAVNMVDLSDNDIKLTRDHNLTYQDLPFFSFNSPYNTPRNIVRLDLSNNQIGDQGAKVIADGLANWVFPITKHINLSGNKISDTGKGFIANAMHKMNQGLVVTFETIQNASKETFKISY
ncbi:unnamed protein product [Ectocarpus sp. 12 AP-2014]